MSDDIEVQKEEYRDKDKKIVRTKLIYSPLMDNKCDEFVLSIQSELQENKVFMPGKGEGHLF